MKTTIPKMVPRLGKCAKDWISVLYNPFKDFDTLPCIPDIITFPSQKVMYKTRGVFTINSTGSGYVSMNPYVPTAGAFTVSQPQSWAPLIFTDGTATGLNAGINPMHVRLSGIPLAGYGANYWNSPYSSDQVLIDLTNDSLQWRVVGAGLKVKYAGTPLNRKGTVVLYEDPTNDGWLDTIIPSGRSENELLQIEEATYTALTEDEYSVTFKPRQQLDLEYSANWFDASPAAAGLTAYDVIAIGAFGCEVGSSFAYEAVIYYEMIGSKTNGRTKSHSDPIGMGAGNSVQDVSPPLESMTKTAAKKEREALKNVYDESGTFPSIPKPLQDTGIRFVKRVIKRMGLAAAEAYLGQAYPNLTPLVRDLIHAI